MIHSLRQQPQVLLFFTYSKIIAQERQKKRGLKPLFSVYKVVSTLIPGPMLLETVQD